VIWRGVRPFCGSARLATLAPWLPLKNRGDGRVPVDASLDDLYDYVAARVRDRRSAAGVPAYDRRRDHLRALAQRIEVDAKEVRIMGSKSELLRTLIAASSAKTAGFGVPSFVPKWRARRDSNS
jgi:hypothetical protein